MTYFGVAESSGLIRQPSGFDAQGRPVYVRPQGRNFVLVVEARRGQSGRKPGLTVFNWDPFDPSVRPDLQIQANRDLGENPTAVVCDKDLPDIGGVPGLDPPDYDPTSQTVANVLNDFACRFGVHTSSSEACTRDEVGERFVSSQTEVQYCTEPPVSGELEFPPGPTILTVRVRDEIGALGDPAQIVVCVEGGAPCF
ncbi:MAG: hypothetical protein KatS3mg076_0145 [Candidatus Binatia bacterium]|nr:MAG: hypothetical protein KatS3mg076_0145 [Candidatus Binatia bacterium]